MQLAASAPTSAHISRRRLINRWKQVRPHADLWAPSEDIHDETGGAFGITTTPISRCWGHTLSCGPERTFHSAGACLRADEAMGAKARLATDAATPTSKDETRGPSSVRTATPS